MKKFIVHTKEGIIRISAQYILVSDKQPAIVFYVGNDIVAAVSIANIEAVVLEGNLLKK